MIAETVWWGPDGKVGGAPVFDGKKNLVQTMSPVLDQGAGPFSAIAWVKGGATNRVILSQVLCADWLYVNPRGILATDRKTPARTTRACVPIKRQWDGLAAADFTANAF